MAQRRMFSPEITNSDAFFDMPPSTQGLYFQLGMRADDDGFVNPKMVMRMMGSSEDELKVLIAKRFVLPFDNGVIVIKHWRVNNLIRKDWYRPTVYIEQKAQLYLKENGSYTFDSTQGTPLIPESFDKLVNENVTNRPRSIGKDSIGNKEILGDSSPPSPIFEREIMGKFEEYKALVKDLSSKDYLSPQRIHKLIADEFLPYWLEKGPGARKARWEKEKAFEYKLRVRTWVRNFHKRERDYQCRSDVWHRKGESCYCVKDEGVPVKRPTEIMPEVRALGANKRV